jgi:hypothetical protein
MALNTSHAAPQSMRSMQDASESAAPTDTPGWSRSRIILLITNMDGMTRIHASAAPTDTPDAEVMG